MGIYTNRFESQMTPEKLIITNEFSGLHLASECDGGNGDFSCYIDQTRCAELWRIGCDDMILLMVPIQDFYRKVGR